MRLPKRSDVGDGLFLDWVSWQRAGVIFSSDEDGRKSTSFPDGDEGFLHAVTQGGQGAAVFSSSSDDEDHKWRFGNDDRRDGSSVLLRLAIIRVNATTESFATLDLTEARLTFVTVYLPADLIRLGWLGQQLLQHPSLPVFFHTFYAWNDILASKA